MNLNWVVQDFIVKKVLIKASINHSLKQINILNSEIGNFQLRLIKSTHNIQTRKMWAHREEKLIWEVLSYLTVRVILKLKIHLLCKIHWVKKVGVIWMRWEWNMTIIHKVLGKKRFLILERSRCQISKRSISWLSKRNTSNWWERWIIIKMKHREYAMKGDWWKKNLSGRW